MGGRQKRRHTVVVFLPKDVVEKILIRIPADRLIELKVVCKSWYHLISDRKFVEAHLLHWKSKPHGLISNMRMPDQKSRRHYFLSFYLENKDNLKANSFNLHLEDCLSAKEYYVVLSSCDDLLLVNDCDNSRLFVCNPITRLCTMLPHLPTYVAYCSWTLAYNSSIRKYKVFGLVLKDPQIYMSRLHSQCDKCYAFTLGCSTSTSWSELPTYHSHKWISPICVSDKGKLHWVASFNHDKSKESEDIETEESCLLSLDITTEEFKETPCHLPYYTCWDSFLEMNGSLYFIHPEYYRPFVDIWVLKDWDTMLWSKHHVIDFDSILFLYRPSTLDGYWRERLTRSMVMADSLHLVIQHREELLYYRLECKELRHITVNGQGTIPFLNYRNEDEHYYYKHLRLAHVNSLVSWH